MPIIIPTDWFHFNPLALAGSPYHFGLGGEDSLMHTAQFTWDSSVIGNITIWSSVYPRGRVPLTDATPGRWIQQQPTTLYVPISPAGAATNTNLTIAIPGGTAGGCEIDMSNFGSLQFKAIVTITQAGEFTYSYGGKR